MVMPICQVVQVVCAGSVLSLWTKLTGHSVSTLAALTGDAVCAQCLQSQVILHGTGSWSSSWAADRTQR
jgi:hypothetical protein